MGLLIFAIILFAGEIYLSMLIGASIGPMRTVLIMIVVALIGLFLARLEGFAMAKRLETELKANKSMTDTAVELAFIAIGAILLILPGFMTDVLAFLFILPPTRKYFADRVSPAFRHKIEEMVEKKRREFLSRNKPKTP